MNQIKSLAEQIRQRQQQASAAVKKKEPERNPIRSPKPMISGEFAEQIRQCGQGEELGQMVHIRLSGKDYRKLITLGAARLSTQKMALFAIRQLLEQDEIKQLLKQLINELD